MKQLIFCLMTVVMSTFTQAQPIEGCVSCEDRGVKGVVVTDGFSFAQTNAQGQYKLLPNPDARFVAISTPSGYAAPRNQTRPQFFHFIGDRDYNFTLTRNNDHHHLFSVQADPQLTSLNELATYQYMLGDMAAEMDKYQDVDRFGLDCGDIVGDSPWLYPHYLKVIDSLDFPIFRTIGNHDMDYHGRSFETSYKTFENYFGPVCYSFNKGNAHYVVLDNNFYLGREFYYIGYFDERTLNWLQQDLSYVPKDKLLFVLIHIPTRLTTEQKPFAYNYDLLADQTVNAEAFHALLADYDAHIISGHMHYNLNIAHSPRLLEHNTASMCGTWWKGDICLDGTPRGYGIYEVDGKRVRWYYKGVGHPRDYQFALYRKGREVIANVWNWDPQWRVEWSQNGVPMTVMEHYTGNDPAAEALCSDRKKVVYDWILPVPTQHLFRATAIATDEVVVRVTDRFGKVYEQRVQ
ncbi:MAG: calcineurin-like phosphoesterase family protein [Alistipes sp.]